MALVATAPATAVAAAPSSEQYKLELPSAGPDDGSAEGQTGGSGAGTDQTSTDRPLTGIAESADDGALPILLVVLLGTAALGAGIAIMRRRANAT